MKLYKKLLLPFVAFASVTAFTACDEDTTLDGAKAVYLEIDPSEITIRLGDTVRIHANVTNVSGKTIDTPITWSIDRAEGEPEAIRLLGDTAIVSVEGAAGRHARLRATLSNGKYAIAPVTVLANLPKGVVAVDTAGVELSRYTSYNVSHDSIIFQITPKLLLRDFTPTYKIEGEGILPYSDSPMTINYDEGQVIIHFSTPRQAGIGEVSVSIGSGANAMTGSCQVRMDAPIEGASFYGSDYAGLPYVEGRPPLHTLEQYWMKTYDRNMNVTDYDTCRVAVNVQTGSEVDILEAYKSCSWTCVEGSSVLAVGMYNEYVAGHGFDAVLIVASGVNRGKTVFQFGYPGDTLTATYNVFNLKEDFPVEQITTDVEEINIYSGQSYLLTTGVIPASSYAYHKPKVVPADPTIVSVGNYIGNQLAINGLKPGKTTLELSSNGKTKTINVTVTEGVRSVLWNETPAKVFVGESLDWTVNVVTPSGAASTFPVEWYSADEAIATAVAKPGSETTTGLVKGISRGVTSIYAKVLDQRSDTKDITVLPLPDGEMTFTDNGTFEMYGDGSQLVINIDQKGKGALYEYVTIYLNDTFSGALAGNFTAGSDSYMELDGRRVSITSANVTSTGKDGKFTLNGSVTFAVAGVGNFTFKFNSLEVEGYE